MEIDKRLQKQYEGNIRCDLCERELEEGEPVSTIQTGKNLIKGGSVKKFTKVLNANPELRRMFRDVVGPTEETDEDLACAGMSNLFG